MISNDTPSYCTNTLRLVLKQRGPRTRRSGTILVNSSLPDPEPQAERPTPSKMQPLLRVVKTERDNKEGI